MLPLILRYTQLLKYVMTTAHEVDLAQRDRYRGKGATINSINDHRFNTVF